MEHNLIIRIILQAKTISWLILLCLTVGSCRYREITLIKVERVEVSKISMKSVEFIVNARIRNPNNYGIKMTGMEGDLYINETRTGQIKLMGPVKIQRKSEGVKEFKIEASSVDLLSSGFSTLAGLALNGRFTVRCKGAVKGRAAGLTRKFPFQFEERIEK